MEKKRQRQKVKSSSFLFISLSIEFKRQLDFRLIQNNFSRSKTTTLIKNNQVDQKTIPFFFFFSYLPISTYISTSNSLSLSYSTSIPISSFIPIHQIFSYRLRVAFLHQTFSHSQYSSPKSDLSKSISYYYLPVFRMSIDISI